MTGEDVLHRPGRYAPHATLVLIGFRAVGKTTLGLIAATHMRRTFLDADAYFRTRTGVPVSEYVARHGWPSFRERESALLAELLHTHPTGAVLSCGGGAVESVESRELLCQYAERGPVIYIVRRKEEVLAYLETHLAAPAWNEHILSVWARREPWYRQCSRHVFVNMAESGASVLPGQPLEPLALKNVEESFVRFLNTILPPAGSPSSSRFVSSLLSKHTTTVTTSLADLDALSLAALSSLAEGSDVVELRVDLLDCVRLASRNGAPQAEEGDGMEVEQGDDDRAPDINWDVLAWQFGHLRLYCPGVPVLFTVRSRSQGGSFDVAGPKAADLYSRLLRFGLALGADMIDVEQVWSDALVADIVTAARQSVGTATGEPIVVVSSYFDLSGETDWTGELGMRARYEAGKRARADVVRLVSATGDVADNWRLLAFQATVNAAPAPGGRRGPPLVAYDVSPAGRPSRLFNPLLTPVSHPGDVGPDCVSARQVKLALGHTGLLKRRTIFLVGLGDGSRSAVAMCQAAADAAGLPVLVGDDRGNLGAVIKEKDFGAIMGDLTSGDGALFDHVGELGVSVSDPARQARAFDMVARRSVGGTEERWFVGDFLLPSAIEAVVRANLAPINAVGPGTTALMVDAMEGEQGGETGLTVKAVLMALRQMGVRRVGWADLSDGHTAGGSEHIAKDDDTGLHRFPALDAAAALAFLRDRPSRPEDGITVATRSLPSIVFLLDGISGPKTSLSDAFFASPTGGLVVHLRPWPFDRRSRPSDHLPPFLPPSILPRGESEASMPQHVRALTRGAPPFKLNRGWLAVGEEHVREEWLVNGWESITGQKAPRWKMRAADTSVLLQSPTF